jgi:3-methyladenine DNA glycosylase AlkD
MTPTTSSFSEMIARLNSLADADVKSSQEHFGIQGQNRLGISLYVLRDMAKGIHDHTLALELWQTGIHEARMLASMVEEPANVTRDQMEKWVVQFNSWDICDIVTDEVFIHTPFILEVIPLWAARDEEFVKRVAFASMAALVVHRKDIPDKDILPFFDLITACSTDPRNFVKKAVNWALRNIGKFRPMLRTQAWELAKQLAISTDRTARWIGNDAVREFEKKYGGDHETKNTLQ